MSYLKNLAQKNLISEERYAELEGKMLVAPDEVENKLIEEGIGEAQVLEAKSAYFGMPVKANVESVPFEVLKRVPEDSARYYKMAPIGLVDGVLEVGILDPDNFEARDVLNFISSKSGTPYKLYLISRQDFTRTLDAYKGLTGEVHEALSELEVEAASAVGEGVETIAAKDESATGGGEYGHRGAGN
jgi:hypothetical protein